MSVQRCETDTDPARLDVSAQRSTWIYWSCESQKSRKSVCEGDEFGIPNQQIWSLRSQNCPGWISDHIGWSYEQLSRHVLAKSALTGSKILRFDLVCYLSCLRIECGCNIILQHGVTLETRDTPTPIHKISQRLTSDSSQHPGFHDVDNRNLMTWPDTPIAFKPSAPNIRFCFVSSDIEQVRPRLSYGRTSSGLSVQHCSLLTYVHEGQVLARNANEFSSTIAQGASMYRCNDSGRVVRSFYDANLT